MAQKDFYNVLGVSEKATAEEIKKQYRRLAKQHHPDSNKGDAKSAERFKEISEAYQVLGDEKHRLGAFDGFTSRSSRGGGGARPGGARSRGPGGGQATGSFDEFDVGGLGGLGDPVSSMVGRAAGPRRGPERPPAGA